MNNLRYYCNENIVFVARQKSKFAVKQRVIEFALEKKESGPYWKRLVKDEKKQHWLKIDFNKWKDEDESDDEAGGGQDLEEVRNRELFCPTYFSNLTSIYTTKDWMEFSYGGHEELQWTGGSCRVIGLAK